MSNLSQPRFSVVIPCYNQGTFLHECLESLSAQTLPPHEIIVVDDGSTDPFSVRRMDELCVAPIKLIRQENRGLSGARNSGVRAATGEWILPLDADDCLTPDALAAYAQAIARQPEVAVWYPDAQYFGLESLRWESPPFNPWHQLWDNLFVCSSAIHRRVFEAGVLYNERMRQGYEDWEFFVHACVERGFVARGLEQAVFRYRRWGYSMISASHARRSELIAQMHVERPVYRDEQRLLELKRQHCPFLAIAARGRELAEALGEQHFQDYRVVDETGQVARQQDLSVFRGSTCSRVLVSLEDGPLAAALRADPLLLEKVAHTLQEHQPALLWLVTTEPDQAWPGFLLSEPHARVPPVRCVGFCLSLSALLQAPDVPRTGDSLVEDVARHLHRLAPHSSLTLVVGPHLHPSEGVALPRPAAPLPPPAPVPPRSERHELIWQGALLLGKGASKLLRSALGSERHDRLLNLEKIKSLRARLLGERPAASAPAPLPVRAGPLAPEALGRRWHTRLWFMISQPPRWSPLPAGEAPALLVAAPALRRNAAGRALVQLLHELARQAPERRLYLALTGEAQGPGPLAWTRELQPLLAGAFCLRSLTSQPPAQALARLVERLGVGALLSADSRVAFEALPLLRRLPQRLRIIAQAHALQSAPVPEHGSPCAYAAARFNNLIDAYVVSSQGMADQLTHQLYVSASKVHVVPPPVEPERLAAARRSRIRQARCLRVLWVHPAGGDGRVLLVLLDLARMWKQRHASGTLTLQLVGLGALPGWVAQALRDHHLEDMVELLPETEDVLPLYPQVDCLVLATASPSLVLISHEAMAAGLPLVAPSQLLGLPPGLAARSCWPLEHPERPLDYLLVLEQMLDDPREMELRAERAWADCHVQQKTVGEEQPWEQLLPAAPRPTLQRVAS